MTMAQRVAFLNKQFGKTAGGAAESTPPPVPQPTRPSNEPLIPEDKMTMAQRIA